MKTEDLNKMKKMGVDEITEEITRIHNELMEDKKFSSEGLLEKLESEKALQEIFEKILKDFKHHIYKEEKILFPYLINLAKAARNEIPFEKPYFETVVNPINMMQSDHESINDAIERLKILIDDELNLKKINSSIAEKISNIIEYIRKVIYLENEILFPKAASLEKKFIV